jgi:hypothetical protein
MVFRRRLRSRAPGEQNRLKPRYPRTNPGTNRIVRDIGQHSKRIKVRW